MNGVPAKKLALDTGIPVERLIAQLKEVGIAVSSEDDLISDNDKLRLLQHLRTNKGKNALDKEVTLDAIESAVDLRELNRLLTQAMAERKIQSLIKDSNLDSVVEKVVELNLFSRPEAVYSSVLSQNVIGFGVCCVSSRSFQL